MSVCMCVHVRVNLCCYLINRRVYKGLLKLDKTRPRTKHRFQKKEKPTSKLVSQIALGKEDELKKPKGLFCCL